MDDANLRREARKLRVHYSTGLNKGRLQFSRATRQPVCVDELCQLVCNGQLGENAAVLCGAQWVALPQLLNLSEAQRSQTANLRNPLVGSSHVDELVDTLSCEIARRLPKYPIYLHVYNLGQAKSISGLNRFTNGMRLGGMFHGGVEIHGMEWSFGWADTGFTGVFECLPTQNELHRHKEKLELGWTWMPPQEVATLFTELQNKWPGDSYDFLRRNCCHFCDELCSQLAPGNSKGAIPGWLNRLARGGATLADAWSNKK